MKKIIFTIAVLCGFTIEALAAKDPCQGAEGQDRGESNSSTVQSCDPNEMAGPLGKGENRYVEQGEWMNYTIYFENKTNATAAAQEVFVDLPMDPNLDWSTLELGEIVFGEHIDTSLSGKSHGKSSYAMPGTNTFVKTTVTMKDGVLSWYLRDWDPTTVDNFPASATGGFLPPNNPDTHCGEGHLSYRVRVKSDAPNGAVICASAQIVFDSNPMIETDPSWWNTVGKDTAFVMFESIDEIVAEGEGVTISVAGGADASTSSVQLYGVYNTAAAADLDLTKTLVDGKPVKGFKFPYTLSWAAGEYTNRTVTLFTKADKAVEGDEFLTLQLANPVGINIGENDICTVTIEDTNTYATLQDGITNPNIKVSTKGDGKWIVGEGSNSDESGVLGLYHAESPSLAQGKSSTLSFATVKGNGKFNFYVRFVGDPDEMIPSELSVYNGKKIIGTIDHTQVTNVWEGYTITVSGGSASAPNTYNFVFTQGSDPNTHVEISDISWDNGSVVPVYNVIAWEDGTEGGYVSGSGPYLKGQTAKLIAKPLPGWVFDGWYEVSLNEEKDDLEYALFSEKTTVSFKPTRDILLMAFFKKIPYVRGLADPADGGKVTGSGLCAAGKKVTLRASANKNFTFKGWYAAILGNSNFINETNCVATTASLVIDRTSKPMANSKTSTTITGITAGVTYFAVFEGDPRVAVSVNPAPEAGKVTGVGRYAPGKKVTVKATANRGYVFNGWYLGERCITQAANYAFTMPEEDVALYAKFVTAEEDAASIALSVDALGGEISPEAIISVTNTCGVALKWSVAADAFSQPKVTVSGLPAGLKFTAKDIMKKGSKTEVEIPANTVYGAPTAESRLDAKTGLRKPSAVKFTVTTAGKSKRVYPVEMTVLPLPAWAVGTFNGGGDLGQVSLTVAKTGKLSGKYLSDGLTWSLAANSFDSIDESGEVYRATLIGKSGKLAMTNEVGVACDSMGGFAESIDYIAYRNNWKLEPWKTIGKPFAKAAALEYEDSASVAGVPVPGVLALKFAASGAVTVKGSFVTGVNERTGKDILYTASGSAVLAPQSEPDETGVFDAVVFVYLPPKAGKFDGYVRCIGVRWTGEDWMIKSE